MHQLNQDDLVLHGVMRVHREEAVFPSIYPCPEFMNAAGILQDFQTLISNAGLAQFIEGEPHQYVKLTMALVQDFLFSYSSPNPMVHYKIYNLSVNLPFDDFCAAIKVPQWGSLGKIRGQPKPLMDLYKELCQGRSFSDEDGKIRSIQFPSIRYFAYFIAKCVLARKTASKLSVYDLAFISAALKHDRSYNIGALIAFRLAANREKGGICGGLIASRLLAFHGLVPHYLDFQFPIERLDFDSMVRHKFISGPSSLSSLSFEITFFKKKGWKIVKSERLVLLPAPLLFDLYNREGWSLTEDEFDAYVKDHSQQVADDGERTEDHAIQPTSTSEYPYQQPGFDYGPSASSSYEPDYDYARDDPPAWSSYHHWD